MRGVVTFTLALLLSAGAVAQESAAATGGLEKSFSRSMLPSRHSYVITEPQLKIMAVLPPPDRQVFVSPPSEQLNTCWFIRSYIFERRDGQAPVLRGETTCTPSHRNQLRQTKKRGARLVPLGW